MSTDAGVEIKLQRMKEFVQLLPLTLELAGLPKAQPAQIFTADQMDLRVSQVRSAYKLARNLVKEMGEAGG
jgi:hypothetical protein